MDEKLTEIEINGITYECHVDTNLIPSIERILKGTTNNDQAIQALSIPNRPIWLFMIIKMLRWYQEKISPKLGNRCVFDPSCSHYLSWHSEIKVFLMAYF